MLSIIEIEHWYKRLNLSDEARSTINQIRRSQPTRAVQSFNGNVTARFPSSKMGMTIQAESHKNELAFVHEYEYYDRDVLEYYDQPPTIKLIYESANGRHLGVLHTPDYFVLRKCIAGWEECKPEEGLVELASKSPNRYVRDQEGKWRCPPGEMYAEKYGLYYRIRSSSEIDWTLQRNIEFLDDFYRGNLLDVATDIITKLLTYVAGEIGLTLEELFSRTEGSVSRDTIFGLIASGKLYVNLKAAPLTEPSKIRVFSDVEAEVAFSNIIQISAQDSSRIPSTVNYSPGSAIQWDGKGWIIVNVGEKMIGLIVKVRHSLKYLSPLLRSYLEKTESLALQPSHHQLSIPKPRD